MDPIPSFEPPDRETFANPFNDRQLLAYYDGLLRWHGYIRFLGLPYRKDEPDVPIEDLFVEPRVSHRPMRPEDLDPNVTIPVVEALVDHERLVLLGDPGSGKSTLVSWIAWQLSRSAGGRLQSELGNLVPAPMVLREIAIGRGVTWDSLWASFLAQPVAAELRRHENLGRLLQSGQLVFLLDGLDELSNVEVRQSLRKAVFDGMRRYPSCRFVLTSRLVGYDDVPFHAVLRKNTSSYLDAMGAPNSAVIARDGDPVANPACKLFYVAPFSDELIARFAAKWYASREQAQNRAAGGSRDLVASVRRSEHTLRLARIPNLLTFMALIHRVRAKLPDGRALLYDEIAEAYLETIDTFRGLQEMEIPLHQKMRWLGFVGYRMQLQRDDSDKEKALEILVDQATVEGWLREEMERDHLEGPASTAAAFLDYLGRRSGLLLPRGEGRFAFAHLSFQEFFAATYLLRLVIAPPRVRERIAPAFETDLRRWGDRPGWRETLILLFELLSRQPDFCDEVVERLFGVRLSLITADTGFSAIQRVLLLPEIAMDPHSALKAEDRANAMHEAWRWERRWQSARFGSLSGVPRVLLRADTRRRAQVLEFFVAVFGFAKRLDLNGSPNLERSEVLEAIGTLSRLSYLDLSSTGVEDLSPLSSLSRLRHLDLGSTGVEDLSPLSSLSRLSYLDLSSTRVEDLSPLSRLLRLSDLDLSSTGVEDLSPLSSLSNLSYLNLSSTEVEDLSPLSSLSNLRYINLSSTGVEDLAPLYSFDSLEIHQ